MLEHQIRVDFPFELVSPVDVHQSSKLLNLGPLDSEFSAGNRFVQSFEECKSFVKLVGHKPKRKDFAQALHCFANLNKWLTFNLLRVGLSN